MFLVLLVLLLFWRLVFAGERRPGLAAGLGLATGIALWVNQLALAYLFVLAPMWWANPDARRLYKPLVAGLLAGASLLIAYNIAHPLATARSLARKAVVLNRVPVEQRDEHWLERGLEKRIEAIGQGLDKLGLVFGVPPRPEVERLGLTAEARRPGRITRVRQWLAVIPLLAFGLGFWTLRPRHQDGRWTWAGPEQLLLWMFLATFAVGYVSPRYMLPAFPIAALALACARERALPGGTMRRVLTAGITAVMAYGVLSWADVKAATGGGSIERIEALASALERHDLRYCYSAGPMYHVVFAAGERVILSPLQKDRYPAYAKIVSQAPRICYVFRKDQEHKRQHVAFMRLLDRKRISYERFQLCRTGTGVVEVRQDEDCKKQCGKTLYVVLYDFEPRQAITEADMERVRHQERARIDVDRILPLAPLSNRKH
ncbi:MAG: hypothetical protein D6815_01525 [Candidatus Dadabacteria bacterium]|nr:MAG: hypothetical protein D6815_01525 [Candidatus Dadabacteria bacterium]